MKYIDYWYRYLVVVNGTLSNLGIGESNSRSNTSYAGMKIQERLFGRHHKEYAPDKLID